LKIHFIRPFEEKIEALEKELSDYRMV